MPPFFVWAGSPSHEFCVVGTACLQEVLCEDWDLPAGEPTRRAFQRVLNCKRAYKIKRPSQKRRVKCTSKCFPEASSVSVCV